MKLLFIVLVSLAKIVISVMAKETPKSLGFTFPDEWEEHRGTMMIFPAKHSYGHKTNGLRNEFVDIAEAIAKNEPVHVFCFSADESVCRKLLGGIPNLTIYSGEFRIDWARDNAPVVLRGRDGTLASAGFRFNGWGMKYYGWEDDVETRSNISQVMGWPIFQSQKIADNKLVDYLKHNVIFRLPVGSAEQCFLLAYRAFTRECYAKAAMANTSELRRNSDKGKDFETQMDIQMKCFFMDIEAFAGIRDNNILKVGFDSCLENRDFSSVRGLILELDSIPPVMVAGGANPGFNFDGERIQDLMDLEKVPDMISVTSFYDGNRGLIVFFWLEDQQNACTNLILSLLTKPKEQLIGFVLQYIFKSFENIYMSPEWWENMEARDKKRVMALFADSVSMECELEKNFTQKMEDKDLGCT